MCHSICIVWNSEQFSGIGSFFYHVGPEDQTQVIRLMARTFTLTHRVVPLAP